MDDDLVRWFGGQLDEDEAAARATTHAERADTWTTIPDSYGGVLDDAGTRSLAVGFGDVMAPETAEHIARHDPARVLAEVDAKRRILAEHKPSRPKGRPNMERRCLACTTAQAWDDTANESNCLTLRLLALPYADRPGYREEWRP